MMNTRLTTRLAGAAFILLLFGSCGGESDGTPGESVDAAAVTAAAIEGTSWELVELVVLGGYVFTPEEASQYTLQFRSDNRLTGQSDCNTFTALWDYQEALAISDFSHTRSMCLSGSLHNFYVLYLGNVNALERDGAGLILRTPDEEVRLTFREAS